jgi:hypothetical protein
MIKMIRYEISWAHFLSQGGLDPITEVTLLRDRQGSLPFYSLLRILQ